jgi:hypothetical protein
MKGLRALLTGIVDYAGTAPPAALDMKTAMRNYADYRQGEHVWMLGRYIVPLARLAEFASLVDECWPAVEADDRWWVSVTATPGESVDWGPVMAFNKRSTYGAAIDTLEIKTDKVEDIRRVMASIPEGITVYFELTPSANITELLAAATQTEARAKIRTGGLSADMIPSSEAVARFVQDCAIAKVSFKASAGLHHPIRSLHALTAKPEGPSGTMHGFINLFLAAALLYHGGSREDAVRTLEEELPQAFSFGPVGVEWHDHQLATAHLRMVRERFAMSFGSCSFAEPLEDLQHLGWL